MPAGVACKHGGAVVEEIEIHRSKYRRVELGFPLLEGCSTAMGALDLLVRAPVLVLMHGVFRVVFRAEDSHGNPFDGGKTRGSEKRLFHYRIGRVRDEAVSASGTVRDAIPAFSALLRCYRLPKNAEGSLN